MASFEQHVNIAVVATGVVIAPLASAGLLNTNQSLIALSLGLVGGILPDLDSDNSKPIEIVFKIFSIFLPLLVLLSISDKLPILHLLAIWLVSTAVLHFVVFKTFLNLTAHRGIFHSIPMGVVSGQLTIVVFYYLFGVNMKFSTIAGFFIFFGFMIHLLLDEIISLNVFGLKVKRSFGTAFKLYDSKNHIGSIVLYVIIVAGLLFIPLGYNTIELIITTIQNVKFL